MWIRDGCVIASFPIDLVATNGAKPIATYTKYIFEFAHNVPVYLALEPVVVPVKIGSVKRLIALPPFSVITCSNIRIELPSKLYGIADGVWVSVGIVTPYVRDSLCGSARLLGLAIDVDNANGVPYICIDNPFIDYKVSSPIIGGGFIEVTDILLEDVIINTKIAESGDLLYVFIRHIVEDYYEKFKKQPIRFKPITVDKDLRMYIKPLMFINSNLVVAKIGRGFVYSLDTSTDLAQILYHILLLRTFTRDLSL